MLHRESFLKRYIFVFKMYVCVYALHVHPSFFNKHIITLGGSPRFSHASPITATHATKPGLVFTGTHSQSGRERERGDSKLFHLV